HRLLAVFGLVGPLPLIPDAEVGGAVGAALPELELPVVVVEERRRKGRADRGRLRVIVGLLFQQVRGRPGETPVEAPESLALRLQELVREGILRPAQGGRLP